MPTAYSHLAGREVDTSSEEWRHETECLWLLNQKPTRTLKHLYLYGVVDREKLMTSDRKTGRPALRDDVRSLWQTDPSTRRPINPLMHHRGLEGADRLLAEAKRLHDLTKK